MANEKIKCPSCGTEFELSQVISKDIELAVSKKYEQHIKQVEKKAQEDIAAREKEFNQKLNEQRKQLEEETRQKVEDAMKIEVADLKEQLQEKAKLLDDSRKKELELRKQQRELEEAKRALELEVVRKVDGERKKIVEAAAKEMEEKNRLKDLEKDKQLADTKKKLDEAMRKLEQGSQQAQGEVLELDLEERLREEFPLDDIEPVAKGVKGADIIQTVKTQSGRISGKILWETKRTKNWSEKWVQKAKENQRAAKAHLVVIVSEKLSEEVNQFKQINGVWVASIPLALNLASALRFSLQQVARERAFQAGRSEKAELVYNYLTGQEFRNRVEAIIEGFLSLRKDLEKEKVAMEKIWAKREKEIEKVIKNISGMHGELEGIAGPSLPAVKMLELSADEEAEK